MSGREGRALRPPRRELPSALVTKAPFGDWNNLSSDGGLENWLSVGRVVDENGFELGPYGLKDTLKTV